MSQKITAILIFFAGYLVCPAQFNTITMEPSVVVTDHMGQLAEEHPADTVMPPKLHTPPVDTAIVPAGIADGLSHDCRRKLYLQLVYLDNEMSQRMFELFHMWIAREAARLKAARQQATATEYSFEEDCPTSVTGRYAVSPDLTAESVLAEILRNNLAHPRVVLAQAVLETGWFKSSVCRNYNNLFGLTNPRTKEYYRFDTWQESVRAYYTKVQYRYRCGNYLRWLREIGYAEDPDYTAKLRVLLDGPLLKYAPGGSPSPEKR